MAKTQAPTAYVSRVQQLIYQLVRLMEQCDEMCLAQYDVTVTQSYTLLSLPQEGDLSMNALGEAIAVARSTATRMVDQLVRKGLAYRKPDPKDRRIVRVVLTPRGRQLRRELEKATEACFRDAFAKVAEDEQPATIRVLEFVTESLAKALKTYGCAPPKPE